MIDPVSLRTLRGAEVLRLGAELIHARLEKIRAQNDAAIALGWYRQWAPETKAEYAALLGVWRFIRQEIHNARQLLEVPEPDYRQKAALRQVNALADFLRSAMVDELVKFPEVEKADKPDDAAGAAA